MYQRIQRDSLVTKQSGPNSPVAAMEPTLLGFVVWKQESGDALKPRETLSLADSLLENSTVKQALIQFQEGIKRKGIRQLTDGWGCGFISRQDHILQSKRGYHLNHMRMDDLTHDNTEAMYETTYETWVHARVAVKLPESE